MGTTGKRGRGKGKAKRSGKQATVQQMIDREMPGYVVIDAPKKPAARRRAGKAAKTASLDKLQTKYRTGAGKPKQAPKPSAGHGRIVRVRPVRGSQDPAADIGEKAVYLGPTGKVEFRQG